MTLPSSGNISLTDLKTEFGGNASAKLTDYYAGGAFVPANTTDKDGNAIPSSGIINLTNFYGAPNPINLAYHNIYVVEATLARAGIQLTNTGILNEVSFSSNTYFYTASLTEWSTNKPNEVGSNYEVLVQQLNGDFIYGDALNTWLPLNLTRLWEVRSVSKGTPAKQANLTIQIRRSSDGIVLASNTVSLYARTII